MLFSLLYVFVYVVLLVFMVIAWKDIYRIFIDENILNNDKHKDELPVDLE